MYFLASLKLTVAGLVILALVSGLIVYGLVDNFLLVLIGPFALLAVNLTAVIFTNPKINRQPGLLVLHISLLTILVLAGIGQLSSLRAHLEIVEGQPFRAENLFEVKQGPLHAGGFKDVNFIQGPFKVEYDVGIRRGLTFSQVILIDKYANKSIKIVGDDRPLVFNHYRFYTSFNKGFSVLLSWIPDQGKIISGVVNLPSYPLNDYKQSNTWETPDGFKVKFWLRVKTALDKNKAWVLEKETSSGILVVLVDDRRIELQPGEIANLTNGKLRYDKLLTWMGYEVFYDPTIKWLFFMSFLGVAGLGWHFWRKMGSVPPSAA